METTSNGCHYFSLVKHLLGYMLMGAQNLTFLLNFLVSLMQITLVYCKYLRTVYQCSSVP